MKFNKIIAMSLLAATTLAVTSCKEDDDNNSTSRLFRPIASASATANDLLVTWKAITGTTEYALELYSIATDGSGNNTYKLLQEVRTPNITYTFKGLEWDQKYMVKIKGTNGSMQSEYYQTNDVTITYPTILSKVKTIDQAARLSWDATSTDTIRAIRVFKADGNDALQTIILSKNDYAAGEYDIYSLESQTAYLFKVYSDKEIFDNSTYKGSMTATTSAVVDFNVKYNGNYLDIRNWDEDEAKDTLKSAEFQAMLKEGMTVILRGGQEYKVNNTVLFDKSVSFVTGPTLGENAKFISSGGMGLVKGKDANVAKLEFTDIDIYSDKALGDLPVETCTEKGFGGRQVFNENGTKSTLDSIVFKNCHIEGFRAVVRAQAATDNIHHIYFDECTINGIGDQGVVTTTNKAADFQSVTFKNCTVTNIVMLCDLRATAGALNLNIRNSTFCYAPIETKANANTPLLRFNGNSNEVTINIEKTLFGPSMQTENCDGETIHTYSAGTNGSIFLNGDFAANVRSSFRTNFEWTSIGEGEAAKTYGISGIESLGMDENALWQEPAKGNFKIKATLTEPELGAKKWW